MYAFGLTNVNVPVPANNQYLLMSLWPELKRLITITFKH